MNHSCHFVFMCNERIRTTKWDKKTCSQMQLFPKFKAISGTSSPAEQGHQDARDLLEHSSQ